MRSDLDQEQDLCAGESIERMDGLAGFHKDSWGEEIETGERKTEITFIEPSDR
jgi:hypothetical protein